MIELVFRGASFPITKKLLVVNSGIFDLHPDLYEAKQYSVQSDVTGEIFAKCLDFLQNRVQLDLTPANAASFLRLGQEFGISSLCQECESLISPPPAVEPPSLTFATDLEERMSNIECGYETVESTIRFLRSDFESSIAGLRNQFAQLRTQLETLIGGCESSISDLRTVMNRNRESLASIRPIPFIRDPFDGIIAYLTKKCGGNVQQKGIVAITAQSVYDEHSRPENIANFTEIKTFFSSKNEPNSWICYDFKNSRIHPTHYSIQTFPGGETSGHIRSWVVEASEDGQTWTVISEHRESCDLIQYNDISTYLICKSAECRFVRLRQTGINRNGKHYLRLSSCELFGILLE
jgi:hypothetical protein